ncbi:PREDICTED: uncharacterized protein LOC109332523 [Lupinus angustifolius]|uniref:uncharacterized protein LOC109332523 n=1 Tax=Lupinus angustifolius TaxID=3871 RepID=UPI00092FA53D|nr:PREDICTED: uncharacterized protein LOC109332523 [Lupinus angustifolius]
MLLRKCLNHGFEDVDQLNIFSNGLKPENKMILDVAAGDTMMAVDDEQATIIITELSATDQQAQHNRRMVLYCEFCGGDRITGHCLMPINTSRRGSGNQNQTLNFGWRHDAGPSNRQPPYQSSYQQGPHPPLHERQTKLEETLEKFMQVSISNQKNNDASIRNLETQVIGKGIGENLVVEEYVLRNTEARRSEKIIRETWKGEVVQDEEGVVTNEDDIRENSDKRKGDLPQLKDLPYPKRPSKKDKERQYARFLDLFKNLCINIPFMKAMEQMLAYAKFMKDLLTKKRKFSEETMTLEAGCSAMIQKSFPEKTKDPGSFTIPVTIGELSVGKALLDLDASIKLHLHSVISWNLVHYDCS